MANCSICNATVPHGANFCGACGAILKGGAVELEGKTGIQTWARGTTDLAVRVDIDDIEGLLRKGLVVEQGTSAAILKDGVYVETLGPGRYDLAHGEAGVRRVLETIIQKARPSKSVSVLLVDSSDTPLQPITFQNVLTGEGVPVAVRLESTVRVADPAAMMTNLLKGRRRLTTEELTRNVQGELDTVLKARIKDEKLEDLYANLELRTKVEDDITEHMHRTLARLGIEMVQVRILDFLGDVVTELARRRGRMHLDVSRMQLGVELQKRIGLLDNDKLANEYEKKLGELDTRGKLVELMSEFYRDSKVKKALAEAEVDAVQDEIRLKELDRSGQYSVEEVRQVAEVSEVPTDVADEHRRQREEAGAASKAKIGDIDREQDSKDAELARRNLEEKLRIERDHERELLELRSSASGQALLSVVGDPDARDRIERLEKMRVAKELTEDQLVALAASENAGVAAALLEKYSNMFNEKRFRELREVAEQANKDIRGAASEAMQEMGKVAQRRADERAQIAMGGLGGNAAVTHGGGVSCPHCGQTHETGSKFCPKTGKKV